MRLLATLFLSAMVPTLALADVKPHPLFSDHGVLQRGVTIPVWGTAEAGEKVTVTLKGKATTTAEVTADDKGNWKAELPKAEAGIGYTLTVAGKNTIEFKNVAVGDVWICSGQSNMEWKLNQLSIDEQGKKVAANATNPRIRLFDVPNRPLPTPQTTFPVTKTGGMWLECKPETVINFSAVGYFFGRDIEKSQDIPVGLIASDWGGTPAEAWTSREGLNVPGLEMYVERIDATLKANADPKLVDAKYQEDLAKWKEAAEKAKADGKTVPRAPQKPGPGGVTQNSPTALYNGMIASLKPYAFKGAIWYQGESNAGQAKTYRTLFPTMISDWRKQWGNDFPFYLVQLAPFRADGSEKVSYAELRDAQLFATKKLKNVGIAIITDVGNETDIHPQNKEPVGTRLALAARALTYGETIEYSGPEYKEMKVEGDKVVVSFTHVGRGLKVDGETLTGFTVCGEDKVFHPATAKIAGDTIVLSCEKVTKPIAVRFGWVNFAKPTLNFFNRNGLPAVPFRTDDFPLTTK